MVNGESSAVSRHVRTLFGAGAVGGLSDAQLLERFRGRGDGRDAEAAFAVLVDRHGPMVLGVCRRALRDPDDAADAFQATFLVLVRKAGSVRVDDSLGRWLYGVSRRVAARARAEAARRMAREGPGPPHEPAGPESCDEVERRELLEAIDEEVARLPEPFRAAVVLCDLGGLTHEAAARELGCPVGTVESRRFRGRKRLRERLARRGLAPGVAAPAWPAPQALPESLSASTVEAATRAATASAAVSTLIEGVLMDMAWTKIKATALALGATTLACGIAIAAARRLHAEDTPSKPPARPAAARDRPPDAATLQIQPPARIKPGDHLLVEVLEALPGRPISGTRLVRPDGTISLGFYGDLSVAGLTRHEIKVKLVEHLRKSLSTDALGLFRMDDDGKQIPVAPQDSDRVFVDDSWIYERELQPAAGHQPINTPAIAARPVRRGESSTAEALADHDRRLGALEAKLDRLVRSIQALNAEDER